MMKQQKNVYTQVERRIVDKRNSTMCIRKENF
jgi:hypothetical protein